MDLPPGAPARVLDDCGSGKALTRPWVLPPFMSIWAGQALVVIPSVVTASSESASGVALLEPTLSRSATALPPSTAQHGMQLVDAANFFFRRTFRRPFPHPFALVEAVYEQLYNAQPPEHSDHANLSTWLVEQFEANDVRKAAQHYEPDTPSVPIYGRPGSECALVTNENRRMPPPYTPDGVRVNNFARLEGLPTSVQSVVILGPSGSGKTFTRVHAVNYAVWRHYKSVRACLAVAHDTRAVTTQQESIYTCDRIVALNALIRCFLHGPIQGNSSSTRCCLAVELRLSSTTRTTEPEFPDGSPGELGDVQIRVYPTLIAPGSLAKRSPEKCTSFHIFHLFSNREELTTSKDDEHLKSTTAVLAEEMESVNWLRRALWEVIAESLPKSSTGHRKEQLNVAQTLGDSLRSGKASSGRAFVHWALMTLGLPQEEIDAVFRLLQAIQVLGALNFRDAMDPNPALSGKGDSCHETRKQHQHQAEADRPCGVSSVQVLQDAAALLGVSPPVLEGNLTSVPFLSLWRPLQAFEARQHLEALRVSLYSSLVSFLFQELNLRGSLTPPRLRGGSLEDSLLRLETSPSVLRSQLYSTALRSGPPPPDGKHAFTHDHLGRSDPPRTEQCCKSIVFIEAFGHTLGSAQQDGGLEQLCTNYAADKMQQLMEEILLHRHIRALQSEGLFVPPHLLYQNNLHTPFFPQIWKGDQTPVKERPGSESGHCSAACGKKLPNETIYLVNAISFVEGTQRRPVNAAPRRTAATDVNGNTLSEGHRATTDHVIRERADNENLSASEFKVGRRACSVGSMEPARNHLPGLGKGSPVPSCQHLPAPDLSAITAGFCAPLPGLIAVMHDVALAPIQQEQRRNRMLVERLRVLHTLHLHAQKLIHGVLRPTSLPCQSAGMTKTQRRAFMSHPHRGRAIPRDSTAVTWVGGDNRQSTHKPADRIGSKVSSGGGNNCHFVANSSFIPKYTASLCSPSAARHAHATMEYQASGLQFIIQHAGGQAVAYNAKGFSCLTNKHRLRASRTLKNLLVHAPPILRRLLLAEGPLSRTASSGETRVTAISSGEISAFSIGQTARREAPYSKCGERSSQSVLGTESSTDACRRVIGSALRSKHDILSMSPCCRTAAAVEGCLTQLNVCMWPTAQGVVAAASSLASFVASCTRQPAFISCLPHPGLPSRGKDIYPDWAVLLFDYLRSEQPAVLLHAELEARRLPVCVPLGAFWPACASIFRSAADSAVQDTSPSSPEAIKVCYAQTKHSILSALPPSASVLALLYWAEMVRRLAIRYEHPRQGQNSCGPVDNVMDNFTPTISTAALRYLFVVGKHSVFFKDEARPLLALLRQQLKARARLGTVRSQSAEQSQATAAGAQFTDVFLEEAYLEAIPAAIKHALTWVKLRRCCLTVLAVAKLRNESKRRSAAVTIVQRWWRCRRLIHRQQRDEEACKSAADVPSQMREAKGRAHGSGVSLLQSLNVERVKETRAKWEERVARQNLTESKMLVLKPIHSEPPQARCSSIDNADELPSYMQTTSEPVPRESSTTDGVIQNVTVDFKGHAVWETTYKAPGSGVPYRRAPEQARMTSEWDNFSSTDEESDVDEEKDADIGIRLEPRCASSDVADNTLRTITNRTSRSTSSPLKLSSLESAADTSATVCTSRGRRSTTTSSRAGAPASTGDSSSGDLSPHKPHYELSAGEDGNRRDCIGNETQTITAAEENEDDPRQRRKRRSRKKRRRRRRRHRQGALNYQACSSRLQPASSWPFRVLYSFPPPPPPCPPPPPPPPLPPPPPPHATASVALHEFGIFPQSANMGRPASASYIFSPPETLSLCYCTVQDNPFHAGEEGVFSEFTEAPALTHSSDGLLHDSCYVSLACLQASHRWREGYCGYGAEEGSASSQSARSNDDHHTPNQTWRRVTHADGGNRRTPGPSENSDIEWNLPPLPCPPHGTHEFGLEPNAAPNAAEIAGPFVQTGCLSEGILGCWPGLLADAALHDWRSYDGSDRYLGTYTNLPWTADAASLYGWCGNTIDAAVAAAAAVGLLPAPGILTLPTLSDPSHSDSAVALEAALGAYNLSALKCTPGAAEGDHDSGSGYEQAGDSSGGPPMRTSEGESESDPLLPNPWKQIASRPARQGETATHPLRTAGKGLEHSQGVERNSQCESRSPPAQVGNDGSVNGKAIRSAGTPLRGPTGAGDGSTAGGGAQKGWVPTRCDQQGVLLTDA
ncbi:hypothetical protein BESB_039510 [Besnoitia besnoiti]|uniref:Myosin motor domain-containing protein n=1 Tax=Besnoitia besnoiti TaxID=94643 RepID=A0A2A9MNJ8_BESBE|nr:hypothetical protein BESB_039510 [Besnoitia besnoiti]PFH37493.1 hypothetical protein BESB_039510 [Besnoitia besnoiti]